MNTLYYGDNLDILRRYIPNETVDLVYLDPPFNSNQDYNVLFAEQDGSRSAAQIKAFGDTWRWDQAAAAAYQETVEQGGRVADALLFSFLLFIIPWTIQSMGITLKCVLWSVAWLLEPVSKIVIFWQPSGHGFSRAV